jgi:alanyl-tRNA synthetase
MTELLITYPAGSTAESTTVVAVTRGSGHLLFAVDRTPCHPESPRWPDQPADRCTVSTTAEAEAVSVECLEGFLRVGELDVGEPGAEKPAKGELGASEPKGSEPEASRPKRPEPEGSEPGTGEPRDDERAEPAIPCVVHRAPADLEIGVGDEVLLGVDESYRELISASHSRCHLVSLALNAALARAWRKEPPARDSLGNPDFDKLAIVSSTIREHGSEDIYRVGKSLRKTGFSADVLDDVQALAHEVSAIAGRWLQSEPEIEVTPGRCRLEERRTWSCALPEGVASFPCGGTHPMRLEPENEPSVTITWDPEERRLRMVAGAAIPVRQSVYD